MTTISQSPKIVDDLHPTPSPGPYDGVTYYGLPPIRPSHYGWLISGYFFTGGLASAAQFLATVVDLFGGPKDRAVVRAGRYLALAGALISPPLLILDLKTPQRWYNMLRIYRRTSAMSIGSWALSTFGLFSGLAAAGQAVEDFLGWGIGKGFARLAGIPAALAGGVVAIYTGTLLAGTNVPLWASGFPFLSSLFASSAASTAVAGLTLLTPRAPESTRRRLAWFGLIAGLSELFFATRVEQGWRKHQVEAPIRTPSIGLGWRAGVFGLGILVPLVLHLAQLLTGRTRRPASPNPTATGWDTIASLASAAALVGGFILRAVFVFGGKPSALRPQDYFHMTQPGTNGRRMPE